jgi:hypothetical protein
MIKHYTFDYNIYDAQATFKVDTEKFTPEMAQSTLDFFTWDNDYDEEEDPVDEVMKKAERMYSEEDLRKAFKHGILFKKQSVSTCEEAIETEFSMLVEQFKKK